MRRTMRAGSRTTIRGSGTTGRPVPRSNDLQVTERSLRRLLVAGAAGFIGSNFVRLIRATRPEVEITVLDKLTYAGNLANLVEFEGKPGYRFVHGDICDAQLVDSLAAEADAIVNFAAE